MKFSINRARLSVLSLACISAISAHAQSDTTHSLGEVVVTASRFAESADALSYGVSVITSQEIAASGASSVSEAVMKILGVPGRLDLTGGNNYALDLRGFGQTSDSNQVVVLDGRRLSEQDMSGTGLGVISIDQVQRIEVIHGSAAVLYGEGATGGVILISTKAGMGVERHNSAAIAATVGSNNLREVRASATMSDGGLSLDVFGTDRLSDGHRENFVSDNNNVGATLQWTNDWLRVGVQSSRSLGHSGFPGPLTPNQYADNPRQSLTPSDFGEIKSEISGLFMEAFVGDWQFGLDVGQRSKKTLANYGGYLSNGLVDASTTDARARHTYKGTDLANALTLGLDTEEWKSVDYLNLRAKSESNGIYVSDDVSVPATGTRFSVGLRNQKVTKVKEAVTSGVDDSQSVWSIGVTQELSSGVQVFGRTGASFRLANIDEINVVTPGSTLRPQTSRDVELGARWQYSSGRVELRWYQSNLENEIAYDGTAVGPYSPYMNGANINLDPTVHRGVELETHHDLTEWVALRLNVAARQAKFDFGPYAGNNIALVPGQTASIGLELKPATSHTVNLGLTWVSSQSTDFNNQCSMPSFNTLDARYAYSSKAVELALGVANLADSKYFTQSYGCIAGVIQGIYPEAGRVVSATAKIKF
jgi:iron complex outermembrane receptor protein